MPNHVTNKLTIIGKKNVVKKLIDAIKNESGSVIDFTKIIPMPKELREVRSPVNIVSKRVYLKELKEIEKRKKNPTEWDGLVGFTHNITQEMYNDYMLKFGCVDWYSWAVNNWGTKWNAYEGRIEKVAELDNDMYKVVYIFDTAWSTPFPVILKLSRMFPTLKIELKWADEDYGSNVGVIGFYIGNTEYSDIPDNCTKEAYEICFEIKEGAGDYYKLVDGEYVYNDDVEL